MNTALYSLISTLVLVFLAEIGDKTMVSTAIFAAHTRRFLAVYVVSVLAFTFSSVIAVIAGSALRSLVNLSVLEIVASVLFIAAGLWIVLAKSEQGCERVKWSLAACFLAILLSELGDKTQLVVFSSTVLHGYPGLILLGGVVGYALANAVGISLVKAVSTKLEWKRVKLCAGLIMVAIGTWLLASSLA